MSDLNSEIKDPDDLSAETLQEIADIKREEILEEADPKAFDVVNSGGSKPTADREIVSLSLNEKYALILQQVKQIGPLFFVKVSPDTFKLPESDPLNLIWINILTGWKVASTILSQFENNIIVTERLEKEEEEMEETLKDTRSC